MPPSTPRAAATRRRRGGAQPAVGAGHRVAGRPALHPGQPARQRGGPGRTATGRAAIRVGLTSDAALTVEDDGPGVPPERRQDVFLRFAKSPASPGSGLGLALVAQQVVLHGGTIEVGLPPGGCFRVRLPQMPT